MILAKVVAGRTYTTQGHPTPKPFEAAPTGYDSVSRSSQCDRGACLHVNTCSQVLGTVLGSLSGNATIVVYTHEAIRPSFLVVYEA